MQMSKELLIARLEFKPIFHSSEFTPFLVLATTPQSCIHHLLCARVLRQAGGGWGRTEINKSKTIPDSTVFNLVQGALSWMKVSPTSCVHLLLNKNHRLMWTLSFLLNSNISGRRDHVPVLQSQSRGNLISYSAYHVKSLLNTSRACTIYSSFRYPSRAKDLVSQSHSPKDSNF